MTPTTQLPTRAAEARSVVDVPAYASGVARSWRLAGIGLALLPGLMITYLAFRTGGFYAETYSSVVLVLAIALGGAAVAARRPFAGLSTPLLVATGALVLLVAWTWFSSEWSGAEYRALLESQRTSLYLLALLFFGAFLRRPGGLALATIGLAAAIAGVCVAALATRLYPDVFSASAGLAPQRLAFPISYWNALGLFAGIGLVLLTHLTCDLRTRAGIRVVAAACIPITAVTIFFTFSRGATGAVVLGLLAYLLVGRPRGLLSAVLAVAPPTALALVKAYSADLLGSPNPATAAAAAQGHRVAVWLIVACGAAAVLRTVLIPLDHRVEGAGPMRRETRRRVALGGLIVALVACGAAFALDGPGEVKDAYQSFTQEKSETDARTRFREVSLTGRQTHWEVPLQSFRADRLKGDGAGTFETEWLRERPLLSQTREAHSLYIELLGELGLVGLLLIVTTIGAILVGLLLRARRRRRPVYGALFAATLMWAAHAGVDWDWELPALGVGLFALAGLALARSTPGDGFSDRLVAGWPFRIAVVLACLLLGISAARTAISDAALDDANRAAENGDCRAAKHDADVAISAVATHPEGYEIIGYCDLDSGRPSAAMKRMREATKLDPDHWRYWYGLGITRAAAGRDPRPALLQARRLNRFAPLLTTGAGARLLRADRPQWKRVGRNAPRPSG